MATAFKPTKQQKFVAAAAPIKPCPRPGKKIMPGDAGDCVPLAEFPDFPELPPLPEFYPPAECSV